MSDRTVPPRLHEGEGAPPIRLSRRQAPATAGALQLRLARELAVLHHRQETLAVLQHGDVRQRIAVHQQQVGEEAFLDLPELVAAHHDLAAEAGRRQQRLHRREAEVLHEVLEVLRVGAVLDPGEAVVAAGQDADAALVHLLQRLDGDLELAVVAHLLRYVGRDAELGGVVGGVDQPGDAGRDEVLVLVRLEHVERLLVGEAGVVDDLDAVADALLDRLAGARMRGDALAAHLRLAHGHRDLLVGHRRELGRHAGDVLAGQVELDGVHAVLEEHAHASCASPRGR